MFNLLKNRTNVTIDDVKDILYDQGFDIENPLMWDDKMFSENSDEDAQWINVIVERSEDYKAEFLIIIGNDGTYIGHKTPLIIFSDSDQYGTMHERWREVFKSKNDLSDIIYNIKIEHSQR